MDRPHAPSRHKTDKYSYIAYFFSYKGTQKSRFAFGVTTTPDLKEDGGLGTRKSDYVYRSVPSDQSWLCKGCQTFYNGYIICTRSFCVFQFCS